MLIVASNTALAEREPAECIQAHTKAQELADSGRLLEARKLFTSCAAVDCPKVIQRDCRDLGKAVEKATPSLILSAMDDAGHALRGFSIELDGERLAPEASDRPISLDPGAHHVKAFVSGNQVADVTIPVRPKDKNQSVVIQLAATDPAGAKARTAGWVLAGVGTVGLASFVGFGVAGYLDQRKIEQKPVQLNDRNDLKLVDGMRQKYAIADVTLGIGLVSLGAATYLLLVTGGSSAHASTGAKVALDLRGATDGGAVFVRGEF